MKHVCWKLIALTSISAMLIGFLVSLYGIHFQNEILAYTGLTVMSMTCISWWIWVIITIKRLWNYTQSAAHLATEIRQSIKDVKLLIKEYKNLSKR